MHYISHVKSKSVTLERTVMLQMSGEMCKGIHFGREREREKEREREGERGRT